MTLYWWMHWFWITLCLSQFIFVAFGHSLLTPRSTTTEVPTSLAENATQNVSLIPPITVSPVVLRNISQYMRNETVSKPRHFERLPDVPRRQNVSMLDNNTNRDSTVINQNVTDVTMSINNATGIVFNASRSAFPGDHSENGTYVGEEIGYNDSFVQSERIGIDKQDLVLDESTGSNLSAAGITGITLGCIVIVGAICGISFFLYRNQGFNRPQVLNDRCSNPDSSGYIDDASVRDNSEEMYSLDNDSFLNSLEAMTIQNYWTDTVKHTKL